MSDEAVVQESLTTESPSAGLSEEEIEDYERWVNGMPIQGIYAFPHSVRRLLASHRALAQRLREVEARLSTVIRVSQEYADEAAQAQRRLAQLEAQDKARS